MPWFQASEYSVATLPKTEKLFSSRISKMIVCALFSAAVAVVRAGVSMLHYVSRFRVSFYGLDNHSPLHGGIIPPAAMPVARR